MVLTETSDDTLQPSALANQDPTAGEDSYSTRPGQTLTIAAPGFLANDTDPDGDPVIATLVVDGVDNGSLTAFPDGSFSYTSNAGFTGVDSFIYRISDGLGGTDDATVFISVENANPQAGDDSYSTRPGQTLTIAAPGFLANDTDPDGDPVIATLVVSGVTNGTLTAFPGGNFTYTLGAAFTGFDSFVYRISDGFGGTDTATVTIDVGNLIEGTSRNDRLFGTLGRDIITSEGGNDRMFGGEGADDFVFGDATDNGRRELSRVLDYEPGVDRLDIGDVSIMRVVESPNSVRLFLNGDLDQISVFGVSSLSQIIFVDSVFG